LPFSFKNCLGTGLFIRIPLPPAIIKAYLLLPVSGIFTLTQLKDKHGIAIGEEFVFGFYSLFVSFHNQIISSKGTNHNQQA